MRMSPRLVRSTSSLCDVIFHSASETTLQIYDARPYLSALANRAHGKGYEDTKNYRNCEITFMQIENIHHVRESHKKLMGMCLK